jgi:hypothetical protein
VQLQDVADGLTAPIPVKQKMSSARRRIPHPIVDWWQVPCKGRGSKLAVCPFLLLPSINYSFLPFHNIRRMTRPFREPVQARRQLAAPEPRLWLCFSFFICQDRCKTYPKIFGTAKVRQLQGILENSQRHVRYAIDRQVKT